MTSNQYYRGLDRRFQRRCRQLYRLGFRYESAEFSPAYEGQRRVPQMAAMIRRRRLINEWDVVAIQTIHHVHNRDWPSVLRGVLRGDFQVS